jgi:DNA-directed RNA polymerase, beta subunit/140 kD subunit
MSYTAHKIQRRYLGKEFQEAMELPDLIDIQLSSFERFLQRDKLRQGLAPEETGLQEVFKNTFPIESQSGDMVIEFERYSLDEGAMKYSELECKQKGLTYSIPLKATVNLVFQKTGEIRQKEIYLGDIPLDDRSGHLYHQRRRARRRLPDPSLPRRRLQPRKGRVLCPAHSV